MIIYISERAEELGHRLHTHRALSRYACSAWILLSISDISSSGRGVAAALPTLSALRLMLLLTEDDNPSLKDLLLRLELFAEPPLLLRLVLLALCPTFSVMMMSAEDLMPSEGLCTTTAPNRGSLFMLVILLLVLTCLLSLPSSAALARCSSWSPLVVPAT